ncbi:MAG: hypothetical protein ACREQ7_17810, partial [Candidatus Binatia bacterium]
EVAKPDYSSLHAQIAWTITVFLRVRGVEWLLNIKTALVMRSSFESFFVQDIDTIENQDDVIALVYLNELECYEEFKTIQADHALRISALGQMAVSYMADRLTAEALDQAAGVNSRRILLKASSTG